MYNREWIFLERVPIFSLIPLIFFIVVKLKPEITQFGKFRTVFIAAGAVILVGLLLASKLTHSDARVKRQRLNFDRKYIKYYILEAFFGARKQVFLTFAPSRLSAPLIGQHGYVCTWISSKCIRERGSLRFTAHCGREFCKRLVSYKKYRRETKRGPSKKTVGTCWTFKQKRFPDRNVGAIPIIFGRIRDDSAPARLRLELRHIPLGRSADRGFPIGPW